MSHNLLESAGCYGFIFALAVSLTWQGRGTGFTFGATADRFNFEAKLSERAWREFFLPPFFGAAEANVSGFMCSYSLCSALIVVCSSLA